MKFSRKKKIKLIIKRAFDILFSALLILILAPFLAIMYLIVMICNGKPVVFKQERIGKGGKPFTIYKFRSMIVDAEKDKPELMTGANELSDPRLTPLGSFMRKHHIDELLQLFNVIKGDMSFIGYRPERKYFIDQIMQIDSRYQQLYSMRPGVTSYATLHNGYCDTLDKMITRLRYDLFYAEHWSLWFDAEIMFQTAWNVIIGRKI